MLFSLLGPGTGGETPVFPQGRSGWSGGAPSTPGSPLLCLVTRGRARNCCPPTGEVVTCTQPDDVIWAKSTGRARAGRRGGGRRAGGPTGAGKRPKEGDGSQTASPRRPAAGARLYPGITGRAAGSPSHH